MIFWTLVILTVLSSSGRFSNPKRITFVPIGWSNLKITEIDVRFTFEEIMFWMFIEIFTVSVTIVTQMVPVNFCVNITTIVANVCMVHCTRCIPQVKIIRNPGRIKMSFKSVGEFQISRSKSFQSFTVEGVADFE